MAFRLDYRLWLWVPTSAPCAVSAVAELHVDNPVMSYHSNVGIFVMVQLHIVANKYLYIFMHSKCNLHVAYT